jgi:hypothetical protein
MRSHKTRMSQLEHKNADFGVHIAPASCTLNWFFTETFLGMFILPKASEDVFACDHTMETD